MRGLEQPRILPFAVHPYLALVGRVNLTVVESFIPLQPRPFLELDSDVVCADLPSNFSDCTPEPYKIV